MPKKKFEDYENEGGSADANEPVLEIKPKKPSRKHKNPPIRSAKEEPAEVEVEVRNKEVKGAIPVVDVDEAMEGITVDEALAKVASMPAKS